ncbi:MAG: SRPBCC family protein [Bacteroidia bacterium]
MKKVLLIIAGVIVAALLGAMLLPSKVHVERSIVINAPAAKVFNEVNSLQKWTSWDSWHKKDPNMVNEYSGPESGVGNKNSWKSSHKEVGNGAQTIMESVPNEKIVTELDFGDQGKGAGSFHFSAEGEGTKVVWGMDTDMGMNPIGKIFGLFMDKMVGKDFEQGLNNLKAHVESLPDEAPPVADAVTADSLKTTDAPPATN